MMKAIISKLFCYSNCKRLNFIHDLKVIYIAYLLNSTHDLLMILPVLHIYEIISLTYS